LMEKKRITKAITMGFGVYVLSLIGGFNLDQSITIGFIGSILWAIIIYEKEIGQIVSNIFYKRKSGKAKIRVNTRSSPPEPKNSRKRKEKIKL
ncbi:MAG TPA: hypothetical protein VJI13_04425, partial [Candidatus Norongarragalinales archaeon]|nr:hypothetical protein [Candidatus Norongarragalinales archaeon]